MGLTTRGGGGACPTLTSLRAHPPRAPCTLRDLGPPALRLPLRRRLVRPQGDRRPTCLTLRLRRRQAVRHTRLRITLLSEEMLVRPTTTTITSGVPPPPLDTYRRLLPPILPTTSSVHTATTRIIPIHPRPTSPLAPRPRPPYRPTLRRTSRLPTRVPSTRSLGATAAVGA